MNPDSLLRLMLVVPGIPRLPSKFQPLSTLFAQLAQNSTKSLLSLKKSDQPALLGCAVSQELAITTATSYLRHFLSGSTTALNGCGTSLSEGVLTGMPYQSAKTMMVSQLICKCPPSSHFPWPVLHDCVSFYIKMNRFHWVPTSRCIPTSSNF